MPLINCEINFYITWHEKCVIASNTAANQAAILTITDRELYFPIVTLSTQGNTELLQQLKSGFKRAIKWNKYYLKVTMQTPIPYWDYITDPSFHGVNRVFVLTFENTIDTTIHTKYCLPTV